MTGRYTAIEVFRQAWGRFAHKEALLFYPLFLAVIDLLAFFAIYAADGHRLAWGDFLNANYSRALFVHDAFVKGFSPRPAFFLAVLAGVIICALWAMVRAPYFRAIAGPGFPLSPRSPGEAFQLGAFYLLNYFVLWVLPLAAPATAFVSQVILFLSLVISTVIAFTDYVIVFERLSFVAALRRSFRLVAQNALPVVMVTVVYWLVSFGLHALYGIYYNGTSRVFFLLPVSQILVEAFFVLLVDLVLIILYQRALIRASGGTSRP